MIEMRLTHIQPIQSKDHLECKELKDLTDRYERLLKELTDQNQRELADLQAKYEKLIADLN